VGPVDKFLAHSLNPGPKRGVGKNFPHVPGVTAKRHRGKAPLGSDELVRSDWSGGSKSLWAHDFFLQCKKKSLQGYLLINMGLMRN